VQVVAVITPLQPVPIVPTPPVREIVYPPAPGVGAQETTTDSVTVPVFVSVGLFPTSVPALALAAPLAVVSQAPELAPQTVKKPATASSAPRAISGWRQSRRRGS
jgi:hypothetical protein